MKPPDAKTHTILPVLTEVADANTTDIPTLTEIHIAADNDSGNLEPKETRIKSSVRPEPVEGLLQQSDCV